MNARSWIPLTVFFVVSKERTLKVKEGKEMNKKMKILKVCGTECTSQRFFNSRLIITKLESLTSVCTIESCNLVLY